MSANKHGIRAPRAQRVAEIEQLKREGLTFRQIADRLGISRSTVTSYYYDPTGEKERVRKSRAGGTCRTCGAPTSYDTRGPSQYCARHAPHPGVAIQRERARPRLERIAWLWSQGHSLQYIADATGFASPNALGVRMRQMRQEGWDLPLRREPTAHKAQARAREKHAEVADLWNQGLTARQIADRLGLSFSATHGRIARARKAGWDLESRQTQVGHADVDRLAS